MIKRACVSAKRDDVAYRHQATPQPVQGSPRIDMYELRVHIRVLGWELVYNDV